MRLLVIYRPESEHSRPVEEFLHEFNRRYPDNRTEVLSADMREGSAMASLYDIFSFPAILALRDDGSAMNIWEGSPLPLIDEVAAYAVSASA